MTDDELRAVLHRYIEAHEQAVRSEQDETLTQIRVEKARVAYGEWREALASMSPCDLDASGVTITVRLTCELAQAEKARRDAVEATKRAREEVCECKAALSTHVPTADDYFFVYRGHVWQCRFRSVYLLPDKDVCMLDRKGD